MKRNLWLIFIFLLAALLLLAACGGGSTAQKEDAAETPEAAAGEASEEEQIAEYLAQHPYMVFAHTEGLGEVSYTGPDGVTFTGQDGFFRAGDGDVYELEAQPEEGWTFRSWRKDGAEYSAESKLTLNMTGDLTTGMNLTMMSWWKMRTGSTG